MFYWQTCRPHVSPSQPSCCYINKCYMVSEVGIIPTMSTSKHPQNMSFASNLSVEWKMWKQEFAIYRKATKLHKEDEDTQVGQFLNAIGREGIKVYNTFKFTDPADQDKLARIIQQFESYYNPRKYIQMEDINSLQTSRVGRQLINLLQT